LILTQPSQLSQSSHEISADRGGKLFALNKTFLEVLVVETYPLGSRKSLSQIYFQHQMRDWINRTEKDSAEEIPRIVCSEGLVES
jgi:hypothetical protein